MVIFSSKFVGFIVLLATIACPPSTANEPLDEESHELTVWVRVDVAVSVAADGQEDGMPLPSQGKPTFVFDLSPRHRRCGRISGMEVPYSRKSTGELEWVPVAAHTRSAGSDCSDRPHGIESQRRARQHLRF